MKVKTSVTLSEELIQELGRVAGDPGGRSQVIEEAAWAYIRRRNRAERDRRDMEIYERFADELNAEAEEVLAQQADLLGLDGEPGER